MKRMQNQYSDEFKEQIVKECRETGNVNLVARRHEISPNTINSWVKKARERGNTKSLPRGHDKRQKALEQRLNDISSENDNLKRILADKELELAILRELRDKQNPR